MSCLKTTLRLICLVHLVTAINGALLKKVSINKCCSMDQYMSKETNYTCVNERKIPWSSTKIFSARTAGYLPEGQVPKKWDIIENNVPICGEGQKPKPLQHNAGAYVALLNGSLFSAEYDPHYFNPSNYCIDHAIALVCLDEVPISQQIKLPNIRRCCGDHAVYSEIKMSCMIMNGEDYKISVNRNFTLTTGFPTCEKHRVIAGKFVDGDLQPNGSYVLRHRDTDQNRLLDAEAFCLEHVLENAGDAPSIFTCNFNPPFVIKHPTNGDLRFTLYPIGLALSAVFLAATLAAGSLLPASHHVLHWRCQTNHVACLLGGDVLLCITQLSQGTLHGMPCSAIAIAMHFLFLSAFFWLNTMCFNIWWTFRDLRPQSLEKCQERWRLRLYEVYAWGVPLVLVVTAAFLDNIEGSNDILIKPGFGINTCWFAGKREILTYFIGPIGCLLVINLLLFCATARELTCGLWKRELVKSTTERAALGRVCMKLVVVMGITWIADIISVIVGGPQEIWYLTDLINCLQGVFIFIVIGLQPQVLTAVKRIWCYKIRTAETAGTTNHHSSSSQGLPSLGDTITNNSITNGTTKSALETSC